MWLTAFLLGMLSGVFLGGLGVFVILYYQNNQKKAKKTSDTPQDYEYLSLLNEIKYLLFQIPQNYLDKSTYQKSQEKLIRQLQQLQQELKQSPTLITPQPQSCGANPRREPALGNAHQDNPKKPPIQPSKPSQNYSLAEYILIYNRNPAELLEYVTNYTEVVELDDRQATRRRTIDSTEVILNQSYPGHFWVVQIDETNQYYLFPNNHQINSSQAFTAKALFNGYREEEKSTFTMINPARVTPINNRQWQLLKKGDLQVN